MFPNNSFRKKLFFTSSVTIFSIFFSLCFQSNKLYALDFPAVSDSTDSGTFTAVVQSCSNYWANDHSFYDCDSAQIVNFTKTVLPQNEDGSYSLVWTWDLPSSYVGSDKYVKILRLNYNPPSDFISSGDNFFFSVSSSYNVFFGTGRGFFYQDTHNDYKYLMGGLNSYLFYNRWNEMYSCPDQSSEVCQFQFDFDSITGIGSAFYLSSHFTLPNGWQGFSGIDILHNVWDRRYDDYIWTPYYDDSVLYLLNTWSDPSYSSGTPYFVFQTTFYKTDTFFDLNNSDTGGTDVNDAISAEQEYISNDINNANSSNTLLGGISIPISLPFSNWFALFTDNSCVDLTTIPSWFGLTSQHLCSPWNSSIRSTLTPIVSVASTMLLFGFIISFLRGRNDGSVIDSVKGTWYG